VRVRVVTKLICSSAVAVGLVAALTPPVGEEAAEWAGQLGAHIRPPAGLPDTPVPLRTTVTDRDGTPIASLCARYRILLARVAPCVEIATRQIPGVVVPLAGQDETRRGHLLQRCMNTRSRLRPRTLPRAYLRWSETSDHDPATGGSPRGADRGAPLSDAARPLNRRAVNTAAYG
jgi:hypothetical protein